MKTTKGLLIVIAAFLLTSSLFSVAVAEGESNLYDYVKAFNSFVFGLGAAGTITGAQVTGSNALTLMEGETGAYVVGGKDYAIKLDFVGSTTAKFVVNGAVTSAMAAGSNYVFYPLRLTVTSVDSVGRKAGFTLTDISGSCGSQSSDYSTSITQIVASQDAVTVYYTVSNSVSCTSSVEVHIRVNGKDQAYENIGLPTPAANFRYNIPASAFQAGQNTISIIADPNNRLNDPNRGNNLATKIYMHDSAKPDVAVVSMPITPSSPITGDAVKFLPVIKNVGTVPVDGVFISDSGLCSLKTGGSGTASGDTNKYYSWPLKPGESFTYPFIRTVKEYTGCTYTFAARADGDSNTANDKKEVTFTVSNAKDTLDISVEAITGSSAPQAGQSTTYEAIIRNVGSLPVTSITFRDISYECATWDLVEFRGAQAGLGIPVTVNLQPGDKYVYPFSFVFSEADTCVMAVEATTSGDATASNNLRKILFTVKPSPAGRGEVCPARIEAFTDKSTYYWGDWRTLTINTYNANGALVAAELNENYRLNNFESSRSLVISTAPTGKIVRRSQMGSTSDGSTTFTYTTTGNCPLLKTSVSHETVKKLSAPECKDSDNGRNYGTKGTTSGVYAGREQTLVDTCTNANTLQELYCLDGVNIDSDFTTCPGGCSNGVCVKKSESVGSIRDVRGEGEIIEYTVGGVDYKVMVSFIGLQSGSAFAQFVVNGEPTDRIATGASHKLGDGAIIAVASISAQNNAGSTRTVEYSLIAANNKVSCIDGDNGKNYYTKSTAKGLYNGIEHQFTDTCVDNTLEESYCRDSVNVNIEYTRCPAGCVDGACRRETPNVVLDLASYPKMFVDGEKFNALIVVSSRADSRDVLAAVDVSASIQSFDAGAANSGVPIKVGSIKVDTEIKDPFAQNVITIGTPCMNTVTAAWWQRDERKPEDKKYEADSSPCAFGGLRDGQSMIKLQEHQGAVGLIISGTQSTDTREAARALAKNYQTWQKTGEFKGKEVWLSAYDGRMDIAPPQRADCPAKISFAFDRSDYVAGDTAHSVLRTYDYTGHPIGVDLDITIDHSGGTTIFQTGSTKPSGVYEHTGTDIGKAPGYYTYTVSSKKECSNRVSATATIQVIQKDYKPAHFQSSYDFAPGWNLIGSFLTAGGGIITANTCTPDNLQSAYYYNPVARKYEPAKSRALPETIGGYLANTPVNSLWVKTRDSCTISYSVADSYSWINEASASGKIKRGVNFLAIVPEMVGREIYDFRGSCTINKAYAWNSQKKNWVNALGIPIGKPDIGHGFVVSVADDCILGAPVETPPLPPE